MHNHNHMVASLMPGTCLLSCSVSFCDTGMSCGGVTVPLLILMSILLSFSFPLFPLLISPLLNSLAKFAHPKHNLLKYKDNQIICCRGPYKDIFTATFRMFKRVEVVSGPGFQTNACVHMHMGVHTLVCEHVLYVNTLVI